jgi:hypothetical protein
VISIALTLEFLAFVLIAGLLFDIYKEKRGREKNKNRSKND